uniref:Large ribosomal subunit protein bL34m n=1 Tax=Dermatophagoides pteronyssinus TaxID=6956 RepID=A0A6P6XKP0_DERPT|nr:39S ribosomal protein L34, mitochondrial-like [Dermatophagoides pteronyssinus]
MLNLIRPTFANVSLRLSQQNILFQQVRENVRWYFERCSEVKRIRKHGWKKRISTPSGRQIIMRRILKDRHVLSH